MTYSLDLREAALSYIKKGGSKVEASRLFGFSRNTLYRWLNADDLAPKKAGFRHRKIDKAALKKHTEEHPDMFLHERAEVFGVHTSSISRALKTLKIVKKRARI
ncbi:IS630 transposase-related protein [Nitrosococcus oceani]|uniref:Fis family transcriptional regulator n=1 Tax=Nitrosococcus oceani C-27 TaxID=314279 RepID=A0A0E2YXB4_9GAMM|nr:IS630 transposase-related protein [Nitrosococcus oceani]EDZ66352.1 Transposase subfamily [Nitrosococcus oceani AFC27]KFI18098.1 Fis family transcriptional regulator [Nitrosococcus oceani C-27]KFI24097.1 Fis family transcriptional regulator [Nitrosococcus oceani]GEM21338.1 Fis family transcriptional regulator [Nitrosococcus oceani]